MICPECGGCHVKVIDTLPHENTKLFRRRKCPDCSHIFRTVETIDDGSAKFRYEYSEAQHKRNFSKGRNK